MAIRMTGMISGLDTEALVSAMVSAYSVKKTSIEKQKTKTEWKRDAWKELNTKIKNLFNSVSSLRYSSAYSVKKATASDATKVTVSASNTAVNGTQKLNVVEVASAGYLTGAKLDSATKETSTLKDLGFTDTNGKISVEVGGKKTEISVTADTTISTFVSQLKDAGVGANYDATNQRIFVNAKDSGAANDFTLIGSDQGGLNALAALGLSVSGSDSSTAASAYNALSKYADDAYSVYATEIADGTMSKSQAVVSYMKNVLKDISDKKDENTTLTSENAELAEKKNYVEAYKAASDKLDTLTLSARERAEFTELMSQNDTSKYVYTDADGNRQYVTGEEEVKDEDGNVTGYKYTYTKKVTDADGNETEEVETVTSATKLQTVTERAEELARTGGLTKTADGEEVLDAEAYGALRNSITTVRSFESKAENAAYVAEVAADYAADPESLTQKAADLAGQITANNATIAANNTFIKDNTEIDNGDYTEARAEELEKKISFAKGVTSGDITVPTSNGAKRINGTDAEIELNGVTYTGASNNFSINGLMITANVKTQDPIYITVNNDTQGVYDKIKNFLKEYNTLMNEMTKLFNADSSKGYEPLTDEEKDAMTDTEVEKWEEKIKNSLFRRDQTLGGVMNSMQMAMYQSYKIGDKTYSLSTFGIKTLGVFGANENEENAYHIDGDKDDANTSGNTDKLMAALQEDPESVVEFMKKLTSGLYTELDKKMKSSSLKSAYTVYNDKQIDKDIKSYSTQISKWEDKISAYEDKYYKQFAAMEKTLADLQSKSSSLGQMMG